MKRSVATVNVSHLGVEDFICQIPGLRLMAIHYSQANLRAFTNTLKHVQADPFNSGSVPLAFLSSTVRCLPCIHSSTLRLRCRSSLPANSFYFPGLLALLLDP